MELFKIEGNMAILDIYGMTQKLRGGQCFNIRSYCIPLDYITILQSWIIGGCCDKKQIPCKNNCGTENKGGVVHSDLTVWEDVESPIGTHIL